MWRIIPAFDCPRGHVFDKDTAWVGEWWRFQGGNHKQRGDPNNIDNLVDTAEAIVPWHIPQLLTQTQHTLHFLLWPKMSTVLKQPSPKVKMVKQKNKQKKGLSWSDVIVSEALESDCCACTVIGHLNQRGEPGDELQPGTGQEGKREWWQLKGHLPQNPNGAVQGQVEKEDSEGMDCKMHICRIAVLTAVLPEQLWVSEAVGTESATERGGWMAVGGVEGGGAKGELD